MMSVVCVVDDLRTQLLEMVMRVVRMVCKKMNLLFGSEGEMEIGNFLIPMGSIPFRFLLEVGYKSNASKTEIMELTLKIG